MKRPSAIDKRSLTDKVVAELTRLIETGQLKPGDPLVEKDLAEDLGVSRAPVREALRILETRGLVTRPRGRSGSVVQLSHRKIKEIYALRVALERMAFDQLIRTATAATLVPLEKIVERMRRCEQSGDTYRLAELDLEFHSVLCQLSGNEMLNTVISEALMVHLRMLLRLVRATYSEPSRLVEEHEQLLEAIRARDGDRAVKMLEDHLRDGLARVEEKYRALVRED